MTEETLLFESTITANIDIEDAKNKLMALKTKVTAVKTAIEGTFKATSEILANANLVIEKIGFSAQKATESITGLQTALDHHALELERVKREQQDLVLVAEEEYNALKRLNQEYEGRIEQLQIDDSALRSTIGGLQDRIRWLEQHGNTVVVTGKKEREEIDKTKIAYNTLALTMQDVVARYTSSIIKTRGEFQKVGGMMAGEAMSNAIRTYNKSMLDTGENIEHVSEQIRTAIQAWAEEEAGYKNWNETQTKAIVKAWLDLFNALVGNSILPELIEGMEKYLVTEMEKVLNIHADIIDELLVDKTKKASVDVLAVYKQLLDAVKMEQTIFSEQHRDAQQIIADYVKEFNDNADEYLEKYRELAGWSKSMTLEDVSSKIASEGKTIIDVVNRVNASARGVPASLKAAMNNATGIILGDLEEITTGSADTKNVIKDQFEGLPLELQYAITKSAQNLTAALQDATAQPVKDTVAGVVSAFEPLGKYMADLGKQVGMNFVESILYQIKYGFGSEQAKKMQIAAQLERAMLSGSEALKKRAREEANYYGVALKDAADETEHEMRAIRQSFMDTAKNVGLAFDTMIQGQLPFRDSLGGVAVAFDQLFTVVGRNIGVQQKLSSVQADADRVMRLASAGLSGYRRENELLDRGLNRLASSVDKTSDEMKAQGQILIKLHELRRQQFQAQMKALGEWIKAHQYVVDLETEGGDKLKANREKAAQALVKATQELEKMGIASAVFKDVGDDMEALYQKMEKFGVGAAGPVGLGRAVESVSDNAIKMIAGLNNEVEKMTKTFPKRLSMFNRAIQDIEQNSKHFLTTLRDGGKISTERLQDLLLAYQNLATEAGQLREAGALTDPELARFWENVQRNALLSIRDFALMAQRARTVEAVKEKLFGTTKKLTNGIISLGSAAAKHIPIIGQKARVSAEQMEKFRSATDSVQGSMNGITFALQGLDPVFSDMSYGMGEMGRQFGSVMTGMAAVAQVKTASMIKAFTALKIAAIGIVGIFGALIISTGKLAAEVTTLNITMKTVATNLKVPIGYAERWVSVLKETGITTKEATTAVTNWMRATLAFDWTDPIDNATYSLKDLARAAQQVAVTVGEDSSATFARFLDFIQTGNSQLLNEINIMKNANQMYEEYADAIGKSAKALTVRQQQEALISGLMREAAKLQGVYTEAMKTAAKQLGSMKRYMEELRYEWGKHFEPILALIIFRFNQLLQFLTDIPEKTKKTVTTFITIATAISGMVIGFGFLIPKLKVVLGLFKAFAGLLIGKFGILLTLITVIGSLFARWFMNIEVESDGVQGLVDRVDKLLDSFGGLKAVLEPIQKWLSNFFGMIMHHVNRIRWLIEELIGGFSEWVENFRRQNPELIALIERTRKVFGDLFAAIYRVIEAILYGIEALLSGDWETFFEKIKLAGRYILAWFLEFFFEVVKSAYEWGKNIISSFAKGLADKAKTIIPQIMTFIGNLLGAFLEGHSPAKIGPLSQIDIWGEGIMDTFLRSMAGRRFRFDEDMFEGLGTLHNKAKIWGDNIIDVFTFGITARAASAITPAMNYVGQLIARFLEGHSPPEVGPLAEIMDWGRNAFEAFLAGFEMADFSFLDNALDLIRRRLQLVAGEAEDAGIKISQAMLAAREYIAGAVFKARAAGGPLDLSSMKDLILGPLRIMAKDVGAVLEAMFSAMQAEAEVKYLEEQIENVIKARVEAAGLVFDENVFKELQRQLEAANREVSRAQRQLDKVKTEAGRYGVNILTWEEINAQAQIDLAERRRDEIQTQIEGQEAIQSEIERIRNETEAEYAAELEAAKANYEAAQERADYLLALLEQRLAWEEELKKANEQINESVSGGKDAAEEVADALQDMYEGLEDIVTAFKGLDLKGPGFEPPTFSELWEKYFGQAFDLGGLSLGEWIKSKIEEVWAAWKETALGRFSQEIGGTMFWETLVTELGDIADSFGGFIGALASLPKKLLGGLGIDIDFGQLTKNLLWWANYIGSEAIKVISTFLQVGMDTITALIDGGWEAAYEAGKEALTKFLGVIGNWFGLSGEQVLQNLWKVRDDVVAWFKDLPNIAYRALDSIGEFFKTIPERFMRGLENIGVMDFFERFAAGWKNTFTDVWGGIIDNVGQIFQIVKDKVVGWIWEVLGSINEMFQGIPVTIAEALIGLWDIITKPFRDAWDFLVGNSLIPDLVNSIVGWIAGLPERILAFALQIFNGALALGQQLWNGFWTKITEIIDNLPTWIQDIIDTILGTAQWFWDVAVELITSFIGGIYDSIFNEENGLIAKFPEWIDAIKNVIVNAWQGFYDAAYSVGEGIINGIKDAIEKLKSGLIGIVKGLWNDGIRVGMNWVLEGIANAINKVIDILNTAWTLIGSPGWIPGFPIGHVSAPELPKLQVGGIVMEDIVAQLHAGEVVLPLDRLADILRNNGLQTQPPVVFAPNMIFYPGASPQQIVPAVDYAMSLYEERLRSGD